MNLIIGNGLIGRHLYYSLRGDSVLLTRKEVDLSKDSWEIPKHKVAYICAGITSTEECEKHREESQLVNITNTVKLAERLKKVIWISSERVFDGTKPFRGVGDEVCPTTEYGRQKAVTEELLLGLGATVIRFSKVIGWDVPLFEGWISELKKDNSICPYSNVGMSPIPVSLAVSVLKKMQELKGLFQISADNDITYEQIACYLAIRLGKDLSLVQPIQAGMPHPWTSLKSNVPEVDVPSAWQTIQDWCDQRL